MKKLKFLIFFIFGFLHVSSQDSKLEILTDSVKIGEPFSVSLTYLHKPEAEIFFPDSTNEYLNFEYINHIAYPTKTDSLSLDSAIYTFSAFSINDSIPIQLELIQLSKKDTIKIFSNTAHVFIKRIITEIPDSIYLKTQLEFIPIPPPINYNLFILLGALLLILIITLLFLFRKKIKTLFKNYFLKKRCQKIFNSLDQLIQTDNFNNSTLNQYSGLSKKGLEYIFKKPISTYTSSQIKEQFSSQFDTELFSELDTHIYRKTNQDNVRETLIKIKKELEHSLNNILETRNG